MSVNQDSMSFRTDSAFSPAGNEQALSADSAAASLTRATSVLQSGVTGLVDAVRELAQPILLFRADGHIVGWNRGAMRLYGYTAEEALDLRLADLYPRHQAGRAAELLQRLAENVEHESSEADRVSKSGELLQVSSTMCRLAGTDGTEGVPAVFVGFERDITEQHHRLARLQMMADSLEQQVRMRTAVLGEHERRLAAILQTAGDAIITFGEDGTMESVNPAAERMFLQSTDKLTGQNVRLLLPARFRDVHESNVMAFLQNRREEIAGFRHEVTGLRSDGSTFPADLALSEFRDGSQQLLTAFIRDNSDRSLLQRQVLQAAEEEQHRIGRDLHDGLQQELAGLGMIAHSLFEKLSAGGFAEATIAARLSSGIAQTLNNVRLLARSLVALEVSDYGLSESLRTLAQQTQDRSGVRCVVSCEDAPATMDDVVATHLYRIAQEAVTNALKHARATQIDMVLREIDTHIVLRISDNGGGIDRRLNSGNGIGLRAMEYRAGLIGGTLRVDSAADCGTHVTCRVPMVEPLPTKRRTG